MKCPARQPAIQPDTHLSSSKLRLAPTHTLPSMGACVPISTLQCHLPPGARGIPGGSVSEISGFCSTNRRLPNTALEDGDGIELAIGLAQSMCTGGLQTGGR